VEHVLLEPGLGDAQPARHARSKEVCTVSQAQRGRSKHTEERRQGSEGRAVERRADRGCVSRRADTVHDNVSNDCVRIEEADHGDSGKLGDTGELPGGELNTVTDGHGASGHDGAIDVQVVSRGEVQGFTGCRGEAHEGGAGGGVLVGEVKECGLGGRADGDEVAHRDIVHSLFAPDLSVTMGEIGK
jgi:hypothetical protein